MNDFIGIPHIVYLFITGEHNLFIVQNLRIAHFAHIALWEWAHYITLNLARMKEPS